MIKLDISLAIFLYLLFTVIIVFVLWIFLERRTKSNDFKIDNKDIWQCSVCRYVYINLKKEDFSRCPRCKSINKKGVYGL